MLFRYNADLKHVEIIAQNSTRSIQVMLLTGNVNQNYDVTNYQRLVLEGCGSHIYHHSTLYILYIDTTMPLST